MRLFMIFRGNAMVHALLIWGLQFDLVIHFCSRIKDRHCSQCTGKNNLYGFSKESLDCLKCPLGVTLLPPTLLSITLAGRGLRTRPAATQRHLLTAYDHWPGRGAACVFCAYLASRENCQIGPILLSFVGEKMQIDKISTYCIKLWKLVAK